MTPTLDTLRAFVAVAEAAGFRRASRIVGAKQSVLSRRVSDLEDMLGTSLFERTREGVQLTHAGSRFLREVRPVFTGLDSAIRIARSAGAAAEGCISIGTVASISSGFLYALLRGWRSAHGAVGIQFEAGLAQEHIGRVVARQLDLAIVAGSPSSPEYETDVLWSEAVFVALPGQHALSGRDSVELEELQKQCFLVTRQPPGPDVHDWILRRFSNLGSSPTIDEQSVGRETLFSMIGLGFGITFASSAETAIHYPNVSFVQVEGEMLPFSFVWSAANDNPALRRFLSEARLLARERIGAPSRTPGRLP